MQAASARGERIEEMGVSVVGNATLRTHTHTQPIGRSHSSMRSVLFRLTC